MAKTLDSSDEEFVEFEEDDGEIVVIKSVSQLLKEANMELDRRQDHINILNQNMSEMTLEIQSLKRELALQKENLQQSNSMKIYNTGQLSSSSSSSLSELAPVCFRPPTVSNIDDSFQKCSLSSIDDFDILSNNKSCQTETFQKRMKHKATQTRFNKHPLGIFQEGIVDLNSDERNERKQASEKSSIGRISISTALGWPNAFKEVGLNMICHLKQTMDPFNMTSTLDNDFENPTERRTRTRNVRKSSLLAASNSPADSDIMTDGTSGQKNLVKCPYCYEEMDSCCMQRHIQSMCGTLDILSFC